MIDPLVGLFAGFLVVLGFMLSYFVGWLMGHGAALSDWLD